MRGTWCTYCFWNLKHLVKGNFGDFWTSDHFIMKLLISKIMSCEKKSLKELLGVWSHCCISIVHKIKFLEWPKLNSKIWLVWRCGTTGAHLHSWWACKMICNQENVSYKIKCTLMAWSSYSTVFSKKKGPLQERSGQEYTPQVPNHTLRNNLYKQIGTFTQWTRI
jgi:hypothetical protein